MWSTFTAGLQMVQEKLLEEVAEEKEQVLKRTVCENVTKQLHELCVMYI